MQHVFVLVVSERLIF